MLGAGGSSGSTRAPGPRNVEPGPSSETAPPGTEKPKTPKRTAREKTASEVAEALEKKAVLKINEADGLEQLLRRSGVCLGSVFAWMPCCSLNCVKGCGTQG